MRTGRAGRGGAKFVLQHRLEVEQSLRAVGSNLRAVN
jgi:hypothetical protein